MIVIIYNQIFASVLHPIEHFDFISFLSQMLTYFHHILQLLLFSPFSMAYNVEEALLKGIDSRVNFGQDHNMR